MGFMSLQWGNNGRDSASNHQPHDCLLNCLFRRRSWKTPKLGVTGLCTGNSPGTDEFPPQMASNAENVSIWWRHHVASMAPKWNHHLMLIYMDIFVYSIDKTWKSTFRCTAWDVVTTLTHAWVPNICHHSIMHFILKEWCLLLYSA